MNRRAFTLLEMLVCGFLVSCTLLAVAGLLAGSARAWRQAGLQEQAGQVAQKELEAARSTPFSQLTPGRTVLTPVTLEGTEYRGVREILADPATPVQHLKRVVITVSWTDRSREGHLLRESWISAVKN